MIQFRKHEISKNIWFQYVHFDKVEASLLSVLEIQRLLDDSRFLYLVLALHMY